MEIFLHTIFCILFYIWLPEEELLDQKEEQFEGSLDYQSAMQNYHVS